MKPGFYIILAAQFFSALADNALLFAAIALLQYLQAPDWYTPVLQQGFIISYIVLSPFVGAFADSLPKGRVMFLSNNIKIIGCIAMLVGVHPLLAYGLVGLGAAIYSPAKYGILTEYLPPEKLVLANSWMEGLTVLAIILGAVLGGLLTSPSIADPMLQWWDVPFIDTGIDTAPQLAIAIIVAIYLVAALFNLYIPRIAIDHKPLSRNPVFLLGEFWHCFKLLWKDPLGQVSLAVTTLFWGVGATLRLLVLGWAAIALHYDMPRGAALTAWVAVGIAFGAMLAARFVKLEHSVKVLPVGIAMGLMVLMMIPVTNSTLATLL
ncbi:MAG: lysophospholipid transporter LplT, partial [Gallionella sp.]